MTGRIDRPVILFYNKPVSSQMQGGSVWKGNWNWMNG